MSSQEENIPPVTDGDSKTTQSSKTKRINNINYGGKRLKKCVECDQFASSNRSAKCPNGHPFRIKRKPVEAPPGSTCVTTVDRDLKKSVKTLNEHHHWHIVTLRAKRHKNGLEFRYEGTEGFGENFIEDPTINSAIKRAFEPRFKREVTEYKPPNIHAQTPATPEAPASASASASSSPSATLVSTEVVLEVLEEGDSRS